MPYWINSAIIIGLSWFNIVAAFILIYYVFRRRKSSPSLVSQQAESVEEEAEKLDEQPEELITMQILDQYCELQAPQIKNYDVRHPEDVVDSQC
jgi:flagellar biosynthesis/type III secretory pathway M-ring protein FliF/YscJ